MTDTEPTVDLSTVRWTVERDLRQIDPIPTWRVLGMELQPDGYDYIVHDLRIERSEDANGVDASRQLAEAVAHALLAASNGDLVKNPCGTCGHGREDHHKLHCEHPDCEYCNGWTAPGPGEAS